MTNVTKSALIQVKGIAIAGFLCGAIIYPVAAQETEPPYIDGTENPSSSLVEDLSAVPASMLDLGITRLQNRISTSLSSEALITGARESTVDVYVRGNSIVVEAIALSNSAQTDECRTTWLRLRAATAGYSQDYLSNNHNPKVCNRIAKLFAPVSGEFSAAALNASPNSDPCAAMKLVVRVMADPAGFRFSCSANFYENQPVLRE